MLKLTLIDWLSWFATELRNLPPSTPCHAGTRDMHHWYQLLCGYWELNSGTHTCRARILLTDPSPHPHYIAAQGDLRMYLAWQPFPHKFQPAGPFSPYCMTTHYCRAHWVGRMLRVTPSKLANLALPSQGTCFTCTCLWELSCLIVRPEIDFLPKSLVRFIYKVIPLVWYSSEVFSW